MDRRLTRHAQLTTELELLLFAAQARLDAEQIDLFRQLLAQPVDWPLTLALSQRHGLDPLLYHHMTAHELAAIAPTDIVSTLHRAWLANVAQSMKLSHELEKIAARFRQANLMFAPYKGVTLGWQLYEDPALRQSGDIDIFLPKDQIFAARDLLLADGYRAVYQLSPQQEQVYVRNTHHFELIHSVSEITVELHWDVANAQRAHRLDWPGIWQRAYWVTTGELPMRTFAAEDYLLLLLIHGGGHRWEAFKWLADVHALIERTPTLNWESVLRRAEQWRARRATLLGLHLVQTYLGAQTPPSITRTMAADSVVADLAAAVMEVATRRDQPDDRGRIPFILRLHDRRRDGFRYGWRMLTQTSFLDATSARPGPVDYARGAARRMHKQKDRSFLRLLAQMAAAFGPARR